MAQRARLLRLEDFNKELQWRLLTEDGVVIDEPGNGCPAAGFSTEDLLADVGMTYYISHDNEAATGLFSLAEVVEREEEEEVVARGGGDDEVVVEQVVDWDLQRVKHVESGKVGTVHARRLWRCGHGRQQVGRDLRRWPRRARRREAGRPRPRRSRRTGSAAHRAAARLSLTRCGSASSTHRTRVQH